MNLGSLRASLCARFGAPVRLCVSRRSVPVHRASSRPEFLFADRRADWLRGRAALTRLCRQMGTNQDVFALDFPHPACSLTHSGGWALAAGVPGMVGVGVDFETWRPVHAEMARWFLRPDEQTCLAGLADEHGLLRLWTAKEALFKACPGNSDLTLLNVHVAVPGQFSGGASIDRRDGLSFTYSSHYLPEGVLSVAVARPAPSGEQHHVN